MPRRDVVLVGASAGGVETLRTLVAGLPADFPAAVLVVLHSAPGVDGAFPRILERSSRLPVRTVGDGDPVEAGTVSVALPDWHAFVTDDHLSLSAGPRENGHRPSVDVLFRSAARALGSRCIGVVLSGNLDDGSAGLTALRAAGGVGVVQDPADAAFPGMPEHAIAAAAPEHVVPVAAMPELLDRLVREDVAPGPPPSSLLELESAVAAFDVSVMGGRAHPGEPSGYSCPDCAGVLWRIEDDDQLRFRCRVGHAWSPESLLAEQGMTLETALWMALRGLEEKAALTDELAQRARRSGRPLSVAGFTQRARETTRAAVVLRDLLTQAAADADAPDPA